LQKTLIPALDCAIYYNQSLPISTATYAVENLKSGLTKTKPPAQAAALNGNDPTHLLRA
jgi:hypothetical protein